MRMKVKDRLTTLDETIDSFASVFFEEEDYDEYLKLADSQHFIVTDKWILQLNKKVKKDDILYYIQPISTYLKIISCSQDITVNERKYCVEIFNGERLITETFDSEILTSLGCKKLLKYGCVFDEGNVKSLLQYISNSAYKAPIRYVHSGLGWNFENETMFLSGESITNSNLNSEYIGNLDLKPKGSFDVWTDMIKNEVVGKSALEFGLLLGFASPLLGYLNNRMDLGCMIFNYANSSSKGKTTLAMLATSVFANPSFERGLITTLNSTQNALVRFVSMANSHTVVLDEVATAEKGGFRKTLYQLCSGRDKMRLNTDGEMKQLYNFNSIIITTAEFQIIDESAPNGIRARVFEIENNLTDSAENSNNIKKCVYSNYGFAGIKFVKFLFENKLNTIPEDYQKVVEMLEKLHSEKLLQKGELTSRILSKLAVIFLTALYVNQCFDFQINIKELSKTILSLEQSITADVDIADKAFDCIIQYVAKHKNNFLEEINYSVGSIHGKIQKKDEYFEISILKTVVEKILNDNDFENHKIIHRMWIDKKIIIPATDRPYKRINLTKDLPFQPCFIFKYKKIQRRYCNETTTQNNCKKNTGRYLQWNHKKHLCIRK